MALNYKDHHICKTAPKEVNTIYLVCKPFAEHFRAKMKVSVNIAKAERRGCCACLRWLRRMYGPIVIPIEEEVPLLPPGKSPTIVIDLPNTQKPEVLP